MGVRVGLKVLLLQRRVLSGSDQHDQAALTATGFVGGREGGPGASGSLRRIWGKTPGCPGVGPKDCVAQSQSLRNSSEEATSPPFPGFSAPFSRDLGWFSPEVMAQWLRGPSSLLPEALRLLDGIEKLLLQLLVALVRRQIQAVEAKEKAVGSANAAGLPGAGGRPFARPRPRARQDQENRTDELTRCDYEAARSPCQPYRCKISVAHCYLPEENRASQTSAW